jgi:hypothetical protein
MWVVHGVMEPESCFHFVRPLCVRSRQIELAEAVFNVARVVVSTMGLAIRFEEVSKRAPRLAASTEAFP